MLTFLSRIIQFTQTKRQTENYQKLHRSSNQGHGRKKHGTKTHTYAKYLRLRSQTAQGDYKSGQKKNPKTYI